jgi:hypothetical protein
VSKINKIRFRYIFWGAFVFFGFLTWGIVFLIFIIQANIDSQSYDYVMEILIPMILISFSLWGLEIFIAGLNKKCLEFSRFFDVMKGKIAKIGWYMVFSTLAIALILFIIDIWIDDWFDIPSKIIYTIGISLIGFLILGIYFFYGKSIWKIKLH